MLNISFSSEAIAPGGSLVLLVAEGQTTSPLFKTVDDMTGGVLTRAAEAEEFTGKEGKIVTVLAPGGKFDRVVLAGVGKAEAFDALKAEQAGSLAASALRKTEKITIATGELPHAADVALGATYGAYHFSVYLNPVESRKAHALSSVTVITADAEKVQKKWAARAAVAHGVALTRDLVTEPANVLTPEEFTARIQGLRHLGLEVEVLDVPAMERLGFGALLGVAQGSANAPRTVIIRWNGGKKGDAPLSFIGKGVTFDSGGISIKPAAGMDEMKGDMAGAATVVGLMAALAERKAAVNAVGVVGLVENMVSGNAQRPGDIVRSASGKTIEVLNTDAEGRLVLADLLWYAEEHVKPAFMIDLATLTGAIVVGLGTEYAGLFSNNDELAAELTDAGLKSGDKVWRMPLHKEYDALIKSDIADMKNIGGRAGGAITAAQFLGRFVEKTPWAHLDIAGTSWLDKGKFGQAKGATGFGVSLLNTLVHKYYEKN
ncbi:MULTISPECIES: leucyl aminopeptidase [Acetobacter]|uniref:Probable cytosol aminopeptidase n=1 Tax=Acetobacter thailandicus TaxID=1502842 RepID=A0ABT3QC03_9PROT|nr:MULTISPECIES: leucyl aminopeptidase [Acetobacter]MBS0959017.1 leucyl aminopeptidase [Acetobacter thailandicus]MBS0985096.1 leucyl aminopeptidase [Acetobacter thailandicus]MCX2562801.1 leucyl aminopeptidase [Acetobacter thailandicus]NHN94866.1 leucyl aminopeptidase [Acetobacter thailandicus]OUI89677.1 aminopeptidase A [Acetobacter sp. DmW_043]